MDVIKYVGNFRMEICSKSAFSAKRARFHKLATFPQQGNSMRISSSSSSKVKTNSNELGDIFPHIPFLAVQDSSIGDLVSQ